MDRKRGFEIAKGFENAGINLPARSTKNSAGYDIKAAEDIIIPAFKLEGIVPPKLISLLTPLLIWLPASPDTESPKSNELLFIWLRLLFKSINVPFTPLFIKLSPKISVTPPLPFP